MGSETGGTVYGTEAQGCRVKALKALALCAILAAAAAVAVAYAVGRDARQREWHER